MKYSQVLLLTLAYSGKKDDPTAWLPASPPHKLGHWTHEASPPECFFIFQPFLKKYSQIDFWWSDFRL